MSAETHNDWDIAAQVIPHVQRVLLHGPPGTGKTTLGFSGDEEPYYIGCHDELSVAEIVGHFIPAGDRFVWINGPALSAAVEGRPLIIDEIDLASGACLSFFRALLNDPGVARFTIPDPSLAGLDLDEMVAVIASGEGLITVRPADGFRVLATMNGEPEDLDGPLLDRFEAVLRINQTNPAAIAALPSDLRTAAKRTANVDDEERRIGLRRWKAFAQLREHVGEETAALAVFGPRYGDVVDALRLARPAKKEEKKEEPAAPASEPASAVSEGGSPLPAIYFERTGKRGRPPAIRCEEHGKVTHRSADEREDGLYCKGRRGADCGRKVAEPGAFSKRVLVAGKWVTV